MATVSPRLAASLLLVREHAQPGCRRVLMGRRAVHPSDVFQSKWVFPGGKLSSEDVENGKRAQEKGEAWTFRDVSATSILRRSWSDLDVSDAGGLRICSARETFEETGVDVRGFLDSLRYCGRATTSVLLPRRYKCAYFSMSVSQEMMKTGVLGATVDGQFIMSGDGSSSSPTPSSRGEMQSTVSRTREFTEVRWVTVDEGLKLDTVDVTKWLLKRIGAGTVPPACPHEHEQTQLQPHFMFDQHGRPVIE